MVLHTVYKVINLLNGKYYIGKHSTRNPNDSYYGSGIAINKAIKKYGKENFKKIVLYIFENEDDALKKEADIVNEKIINDPLCYNGTIGGRGTFRHCITDECKKKGQETKRRLLAEGRLWKGPKKKPLKINRDYLTDEYRERCRQKMIGENNPMYGKEVSQETRDKISKSLKGRKYSEESIRKMSEARKGKKMSEETKLKLSRIFKGKKDSDETRRKKSQSAKGRKLSQKTKDKLSKALKGRKASPETKKLLSKRASERTGKKNSNYRPIQKEIMDIIYEYMDRFTVNKIKNILNERGFIISRSRLKRGIQELKELQKNKVMK